jgi:hypothetical protein
LLRVGNEDETGNTGDQTGLEEKRRREEKRREEKTN